MGYLINVWNEYNTLVKRIAPFILLLFDDTLKIEAQNPHDFLHFSDVMTFSMLSQTTAAEYQLFYQ